MNISSEGRGRGDAERERGSRPVAASRDPVLRAKYLDYCSSQLADVFLSLSDERVYELAEEAARESDLSLGSLEFGSLVRLATQKLRRSVPLPDFATWAADYEANPAVYDPLLLGLWREALPGAERPEDE